ncbi:hypothetical protein, partial [Chimaeribacter arupi]|uniref:hypothetical protein n=1 Tax=Chimaeribacter arupi TaxID=2060066 RepID=UPI0019D48865
LSSFGNTNIIRLIMGLIKLSPSAATAYLCRNNPDLRELNQWYRDWDRLNSVTRLILGEGKNTLLLGWLVKPDSADPGLTTRLIMTDKHHSGICKPTNRDDEVYLYIDKFISTKKTEEQKIWLRANAGNFTSGWLGYDNWAGQIGNREYIDDEKVKFIEANDKGTSKKSAIEVINSVRKRLAVPGSSIRLVGLSGVGKTRFAQALFEPQT